MPHLWLFPLCSTHLCSVQPGLVKQYLLQGAFPVLTFPQCPLFGDFGMHLVCTTHEVLSLGCQQVEISLFLIDYFSLCQSQPQHSCENQRAHVPLPHLRENSPSCKNSLVYPYTHQQFYLAFHCEVCIIKTRVYFPNMEQY